MAASVSDVVRSFRVAAFPLPLFILGSTRSNVQLLRLYSVIVCLFAENFPHVSTLTETYMLFFGFTTQGAQKYDSEKASTCRRLEPVMGLFCNSS